MLCKHSHPKCLISCRIARNILNWNAMQSKIWYREIFIVFILPHNHDTHSRARQTCTTWNSWRIVISRSEQTKETNILCATGALVAILYIRLDSTRLVHALAVLLLPISAYQHMNEGPRAQPFSVFRCTKCRTCDGNPFSCEYYILYIRHWMLRDNAAKSLQWIALDVISLN